VHLKRVEMENFKSFGRKLSIPFLDGFTAITGPNGSGKSNIGDAVLFVLGPKSNKAIRAGKLTDLIFNGGKERKPATHCQVSLVFDNHDRVIPVDADEVTLTRRIVLSRSNAENSYSHFYVNERASSLTEFDELLSKARISAEGYNIVRQGDILRITELPPVARRQIIDQIAGITNFDADIEKANKERATVEQNLEHIKIVLTEIDAQLHTLARERDQALKYKQVKDDLDLARVKHAKRRHEALQADLANVQSLIDSETAERATLDAQVEDLQARVRDVDAALADVEAQIIARAGPEAKDLKAKIEALKRAAIQASERLHYSQQEIVEIKGQRVEAENDLKRQQKEIVKHGKEKEALAAKHAESSASLAERDGKLERLRDTISRTAGRASDVQRELSELKLRHEKAGIARHETQLAHERAVDRKSRLTHDVAEGQEAIETQRFELRDCEFVLRESGAAAAAVDPEALRRELFTHKKREAEVSGQLRELEPALRRLQNEYSLLKAQADSHEKVAQGYNRAVSAILSARDQGQLKGICGTIAELGQVEDKLATAMDVAAGGKMQAIVTETDEDAARAIDLLKRNKLGRATFLPLNKMVPGRPAGKPLMAVRAPEALGFALDLVKFDEEYRPAFWYVFRDTVVVKNLDAARKLMGGVRLVTVEGDLIDAGGAMTGGDRESARGPSVKFGASEAAQFERVRKDLQGAVAHQEALSSDLAEVRATIDALGSRLQDATLAHQERSGKLADATRRKAEAEARLAHLAEQVAAHQRDLIATDREIEDHVKALARLDESFVAMEREREEKSQILLASTPKDVAKELEKEDREAAALREKVRDLASQLATKEHALALLEERRAELASRLDAMDAKLAQEEESVRVNGALATEKEHELAVLLALQAQQDEALMGLNAKRDTLGRERLDVLNKADKARDARNRKDDQLIIYRGRIPAIEASLVEVRDELASFTLPIPDHVVESVDELRNRVRQLEGQLERLGNVNMLALEEYDRQAARKEELTQETARLETQRTHLLTLVDEIVAKKKEGFFKVYDEINVNFGKTYARLSNGGKAELLLENPESPFEGGLTMRAQPPGKKVTRLEALSGGEKSLTSMAFIFAIQEFDPSPFYYLDEVDQNLDGINSELLARMVKAESTHAQFIVVSLRKVTLKEAEHVYGVTMMESGLSEIIGEVRISELADEPTPEATH
jgi:chromosome segregation protein